MNQNQNTVEARPEIPLPSAVAIGSLALREHHETQETREISEAFTTMQPIASKIPLDPQFKLACLQEGVQTNPGADSAQYWGAYAQYARTKLEIMRERGVDPLKVDCLEILALTPQYIHADSQMERSKDNGLEPSRRNREIVSDFSATVRRFAANHPDTDTRDIKRAMLTMINQSIQNPTMRQNSQGLLQKMLSGAEAELKTGQGLKYTRHTVREATMHEDIHGIDYVIDEGTRDFLHVDVKADERQIRTQSNPTKPYQVSTYSSSPRSVKMWSQIPRGKTNFRFFLPEAEAQALGERYEQTIDDMLYDIKYAVRSA